MIDVLLVLAFFAGVAVTISSFKRIVRFLRRQYLRFCKFVDDQQPRTKEGIEWWSNR